MKQFALSVSDGHDTDWEYFNTLKEQLSRFEILKKTKDDIHIYELTKTNEYEVTDSFWGDDYTKSTKIEVINRLVGDEIESVTQLVYGGDFSYLDSIFRDGGISGFNKLSNEELIQEFYEKFDENLILVD